MQNTAARSFQQVHSNVADQVESAEKSPEADVSSESIQPEAVQDVQAWSEGFVKPDGTRIELFIPADRGSVELLRRV